MLYKPNGTPARDLDRLILLNIWAHHIDNGMIFAGLGKPSYLLNEDVVNASVDYWQSLQHVIKAAQKKITKIKNNRKKEAVVIDASTAIDYLLPAGDEDAKKIMAKALRRWYGAKSGIAPEDLVFTVGGASAIRMLFRLVHVINIHGRILTPIPYYSLYYNPAHNNHFYFINLMKEPGYRLTAHVLKRDLEKAQARAAVSGHPIGAILFCDPNNPMGYVVGEHEWKKIAQVLKTTSKDIPIIVDEAYAELSFGGKHVSLLTVAPELKQRMIIMRSATKGFSASGERMAVIVCFNEKWREELINETVISYAHAPKSLQLAYAKAMLAFNRKKGKALASFYEEQVLFMQKGLKDAGFQLPDPEYHTEGTFYVLANLNFLFGKKISSAASKALGRRGAIMTDEDICYQLLFQERIMVAPFSYFGGDPYLGYVRITCCGGIPVLQELLNRLIACRER